MEKRKSGSKGKITKEINLDDGVSASLTNQILLIKGPKGESNRKVSQHSISIRIDSKKITLESKRGTKEDKKIIKLIRTQLKKNWRLPLINYLNQLLKKNRVPKKSS